MTHLEKDMELLTEKYEKKLVQKDEQYSTQIKELKLRVAEMEQDSENVDKYLAEKDKVEREITELREKLALAEKMRKEECNNKEVEKMDAVEKLRK